MIERPCYGKTDLFFSVVITDIRRAKSICEACEHRSACLTGARARRERFGVWGGQYFNRGEQAR